MVQKQQEVFVRNFKFPQIGSSLCRYGRSACCYTKVHFSWWTNWRVQNHSGL